jgi:hypothetical protein
MHIDPRSVLVERGRSVADSARELTLDSTVDDRVRFDLERDAP